MAQGLLRIFSYKSARIAFVGLLGGLSLFLLLLMTYEYIQYTNDFYERQSTEHSQVEAVHQKITNQTQGLLNLIAFRLENKTNSKLIPSILATTVSATDQSFPQVHNVLYRTKYGASYTRAGLSNKPIIISESLMHFQKVLPNQSESLGLTFRQEDYLASLGKYEAISVKLDGTILHVHNMLPMGFLEFVISKLSDYGKYSLLFVMLLFVIFFSGAFNDREAHNFFKGELNRLDKERKLHKEEAEALFEKLSDLSETSSFEIKRLKAENAIFHELNRRKSEMGRQLVRSLDVMSDYYPDDSVDLNDIHVSCRLVSDLLANGLLSYKLNGSVNLSSLLDEARAVFGPNIAKNKISFVIDADTEEPVLGDTFLLKLIFINYIGRLIMSSISDTSIHCKRIENGISIHCKTHSLSDKQKQLILRQSKILLDDATLEILCKNSEVFVDHKSDSSSQNTYALHFKSVGSELKGDNVVSLFG